jgi:hypothetical protein
MLIPAFYFIAHPLDVETRRNLDEGQHCVDQKHHSGHSEMDAGSASEQEVAEVRLVVVT